MRHKRRNSLPGDAPHPAYDVSIPDNLLDGLACCDPEEWAESADAPELVSLIASLREAAQPHELRGEAAALAAFNEARLGASGQPRPRLLAWRASRRTTLVAAALVGSVGLGTAAAAFEGELPTPLQQVAHVLFGMPEPDSNDDSTGAEHDESSTDVPRISNQNGVQQTPHESTQDFLVTDSDPSAPVTVPEVADGTNAVDLDEPADPSAPTSPGSADDPPADQQSSSPGAQPAGQAPPGAGDSGSPPPAGGQPSGLPPQAAVPPATPPNVGPPHNAGPPAGAGRPEGTGQPTSAGGPESAGPPANADPLSTP